MTSLPKTRVLIADEEAEHAARLAGFVSATYEVVGISGSGEQLLEDAARLQPDLIVLDISMPELNGIKAAGRLRRMLPGTKLVFVTQQIDLDDLRAAFRAGASGYVAKQSASQELMTALRQAMAGTPFVTPHLKDAAGFTHVPELRSNSAANELTSRQLEVLHLIAEGKTARDISQALNITVKTVEFHKKALMDQTGFRSTAELTRYAIAIGIVSL